MTKENASHRKPAGRGIKRQRRMMRTKIPKTRRVFGVKSNQTRLSLIPSSIQTITVGLGVPPSHVLSVVEALVGCTTDREFTRTILHFVQVSPCPEGCYLVVQIITQLRLDDALDWANRDVLT